MEFKIFDTEEGEREFGDYEGCENYEHMYDCANNDVWKLLRIVNWLEGLDPKLVELAIGVLETEGFLEEADKLRFWLKGKPE